MAWSLDLDHTREVFESSTDFTIGLEEEFAIVNPETLELEHRFEDVYAACRRDEVLAKAAAGELIASEVEIRSGRSETFADALVDAGVKIIFNYSEALLQVPPEVTVHTSSPAVDLLYALYFYLTSVSYTHLTLPTNSRV